MHLYTTFSTLASKAVYDSSFSKGNSPNLDLSHHLEVIGPVSSPHWFLMLSYPMFFLVLILPTHTEGWRAESTPDQVELGTGYWTQDLLHDGLLLYQLSYPSGITPCLCVWNVTTFLLLLYPSYIFINGVDDDWPVSCLSIFYFVRILFDVSTACLKSFIGKSTRYNLDGRVFLKTSKVWGSA